MLNRIHKKKMKKRVEQQQTFAYDEAKRLAKMVKSKQRHIENNQKIIAANRAGEELRNASVEVANSAGGTKVNSENGGNNMFECLSDLSITKEIMEKQQTKVFRRRLTESAKLNFYD